MADQLSRLEARIAELTESQRQLEGRVAVLESRAARQVAARTAVAKPAAARADLTGGELIGDLTAASKNLTLVGRTLLVLAGAFLLRAITDSGVVPAWLGVTFGFAYAGAWIGMAYRVGPTQPWNAGFHGLSAVLIGFPLLVEATTRFHLLGPLTAPAVLTAFTAIALGVAVWRRLQVLAWLIEIGGILAALALTIATGHLVPPALFLVFLGVSLLWIGYVLNWVYLRWPVAFFVDLATVFVALRAVSTTPAEGPLAALVLLVTAMSLYLGSIAIRTLLLNRPVLDFEVMQTAALLTTGLGGAAYVTMQSRMGGGIIGALTVAFGAATYAVAFAFVQHRQRNKTNFYFYSSVAIVFVLAGTALLLSGSTLSLCWAAFAVATAATARGPRHVTFAIHAAAYGVAAAVQSGAFLYAATTLLSSPTGAWPGAAAELPVIVLAMALATWLAAPVPGTAAAAPQRLARCGLIAALVIAGAGLAVGIALPALGAGPGPGANAGAAATLRTAVLVAAALLLAWAGRRDAWREAGWLVYPVLIATAFKLVLEDLSRSRPATLFLAFAMYGTALILVPRLRRRATAETRTPPASATV